MGSNPLSLNFQEKCLYNKSKRYVGLEGWEWVVWRVREVRTGWVCGAGSGGRGAGGNLFHSGGRSNPDNDLPNKLLDSLHPDMGSDDT